MHLKKGSTFSAMILFFGWIMGTAFFELAINTGTSGFFPAILLNFIMFLYALVSSLLYAEVACAFPLGSNLYSQSKKLLGNVTAILTTALFLFLMYCYFASFFYSIGKIFAALSLDLFHLSIAPMFGTFLFTLFILLVVYLGLFVTARFSFFLIVGIIVSTIWVTLLDVNQVSWEYLKRGEWLFFIFSIPPLLGAYYVQGFIPTLVTFLKQDVKGIKRTIFFVSSFAFIFSVLWQLIALGTIPENELWKANNYYGVSNLFYNGYLIKPQLAQLLHFINFFSILTAALVGGSFLVDYFQDIGRNVTSRLTNLVDKRFLLVLLAILPGFALSFWTSWVKRADARLTGWGEIVFLGVVPLILVWQLRYVKSMDPLHFVPWGRPMLIIFGFLTFLLFYLQAGTLLWNITF